MGLTDAITGEETRTIRILIISALWHISTALANLLTGYILQVSCDHFVFFSTNYYRMPGIQLKAVL